MAARCHEGNNYDGIVFLSEVDAAAPIEVAQWLRSVWSFDSIPAQQALALASEHSPVSYEWFQDALFTEAGALFEEAA